MSWVPSVVCLLAMVVYGADQLSGGFPRFSLSDDAPRIDGGRPIVIREVPHMVGVFKINRLYCGGSIITSRNILSAGHCIIDNVTKMAIGYGASLRKKLLKVPVFFVTRHPNYKRTTLDYDAAIFTVRPDIPLSDVAKPIAMLKAGEQPADGDKAMVTGWGDTKPPRNPTNQLMAGFVFVINHESCTKAYKKMQRNVTDRMMCAGTKRGDVDACQNDSGGPLISLKSRKLIGITSWGYGCANPWWPGVYTSISHKHVRAFIKQMTGK